jgi:sec-independent protein translocase protein TatA
MGSFGMQELLVVLLIVVVLFGAAKLPQIGKGLGEGIRNFKSAVKEGKEGSSNDLEKK